MSDEFTIIAAQLLIMRMRDTARDITDSFIPTIQNRSKRLLCRVESRTAACTAVVNDALTKLDCKRTVLQQSLVHYHKSVDAMIEIAEVSAGQLMAMSRSGSINGYSEVQAVSMLTTYVDCNVYPSLLTWCSSRITLPLPTLTTFDLDKGSACLRGKGAYRYISGRRSNSLQLVLSGYEYLTIEDVSLHCKVADGGAETISMTVESACIDMQYAVEGSGNLRLSVMLFGEILLVSSTPAHYCL